VTYAVDPRRCGPLSPPLPAWPPCGRPTAWPPPRASRARLARWRPAMVTRHRRRGAPRSPLRPARPPAIRGLIALSLSLSLSLSLFRSLFHEIATCGNMLYDLEANPTGHAQFNRTSKCSFVMYSHFSFSLRVLQFLPYQLQLPLDFRLLYGFRLLHVFFHVPLNHFI
jgi:hypothetical protein